MVEIGCSAGNHYWSSTEKDNESAFGQIFDNSVSSIEESGPKVAEVHTRKESCEPITGLV